MDNFTGAEIFKLVNTLFKEMKLSLEILFRQHGIPEKAVWDMTRAVEDTHLRTVKGLEDIFIIGSVPGLKEELANLCRNPAIEEFIKAMGSKFMGPVPKKEPVRRGRKRPHA